MKTIRYKEKKRVLTPKGLKFFLKRGAEIVEDIGFDLKIRYKNGKTKTFEKGSKNMP